MGLPIVPLPTGKVSIAGEEIEVRGLARSEVHLMAKIGQEKTTSDAEAFMVSCGCNVTQEAALSWLAATPSGVVDTVLSKVMELSGMDGLGKEQPED